MERRLAAVLISDVVGYTKLMEEDTEGTVAAWSDGRDKVIDPTVSSSDGRVVKFTGDGFLAEFGTVQAALECAIDIQNKLSDNPLEFRMAINLGDIIDDGRDIHGEGINVAARLEGIAEPGGICISGDVYNQVRNRINAEYEDLGLQEIKNVAEPVQAYAVRFKNTACASDKGGASPQTEKPSIAVLPFDNMSGDPEQEYFSDGITEDIITALAHLRWLNVIARNSSFTYKGQSPDIRTVSQELNVRYVLEGSIRKVGNRVRINAQLLEGETGNHIWAEKYDRELEDIFEVQDEITSTVVLALRPELEKVELRRAQSKSPETMDAWDYFQKGIRSYYSHEMFMAEASKWFSLSEKADSNFVDATAMLIALEATCNFLFNEEFDLVKRYEQIQSISVHNPDNDLVLTAQGVVLNYGMKENLKGLEAFKGAIEINPTNMSAQRYYLQCLIYLGKAEEAIKYFDTIKAISPKDPEMHRMDTRLAEAYLCLGDFEESKIWGEKSISGILKSWPAYTVLISALGHLNDLREIDTIMEKMRLRIEPQIKCDPSEIINSSYVKRSIPIADKAFAETYFSGLEKAGFPK